MASILLFREAYLVVGNPKYLELMRKSFDWFLGKNRLGVALFDFESNGCKDGLGEHDVNMNQGAESTICFLISLLAVTDATYVGDSRVDRATS